MRRSGDDEIGSDADADEENVLTSSHVDRCVGLMLVRRIENAAVEEGNW